MKSQKNILIYDANHFKSNALASAFREAMFHVTTCDHYECFLNALSNAYHAILFDINQNDGTNALQAIRTQRFINNTIILESKLYLITNQPIDHYADQIKSANHINVIQDKTPIEAFRFIMKDIETITN